jgi:hypothetical protein
MRYVVAMIFAVAGALVTTLFLSSRVADFIVASYTFESPDQVADLHSLSFLGTSLGGLVIGWLIGWSISAQLREGTRPS